MIFYGKEAMNLREHIGIDGRIWLVQNPRGAGLKNIHLYG